MTKGFSIGSEVIARSDFQGSTSEHLSFFKGDILTIIGIKGDDISNEVDDPNWSLAQHSDGREGLVPVAQLQKRTEVKLNSTPWFHGKITRDEAERLLQPPKVSKARPVTTRTKHCIAFSLPA